MTAPGSPRDWRVDDAGFEISEPLRRLDTLGVVLNGHSVWAVSPQALEGDARTLVRWPSSLRPYLRGRAVVELFDYTSDSVVARTEFTFGGDASVELSVTNAQGQQLFVDKMGAIKKPLSSLQTSVRDELLDACDDILLVLDGQEVAGFLAYGTLLGAVRNGHLIGHDNDVDLGYLSRYEHPVDVVRESFAIERALLRAGFKVRRGMGGRLNVRYRTSDSVVRGIDIFTGAWINDMYFMPQDSGFDLPRTAILPTRPITLEGRTFPAPADAEALLAEIYGPGWLTPDPSFAYDTPTWLVRRMTGWYGGLSTRRKHWDAFHTSRQGRQAPRSASPFARWVQRQYGSSRPLLDLGTGNGRDAVWFARRRPQVVAVDYSASLTRVRRRARRAGIDLRVTDLNLLDLRSVLAWGTHLARQPEPADLYARFLLDALPETGRQHVFLMGSMALRRGGHLFLEFRTRSDARGRESLDLERVAREIVARGGTVVHAQEGVGLAGPEDQEVPAARLVARWAR